MALCVYTVEHCDTASQAAIKIHEGRACNFVVMCLHSLIRSRFRNRINSWSSEIFFQSPQTQMRDELPVIFPASRSWRLPICQSATNRQLWSGSLSACLGGNMRLNGRSDNFHTLSMYALNPMEFQGDLISCTISGKPREKGGTRYVVALLPRSSVDQVEDAEHFRNLGNRYPRNVVRWKLCSLVNGKIKNRARLSTRKKVSQWKLSKGNRGLVRRILQPRSCVVFANTCFNIHRFPVVYFRHNVCADKSIALDRATAI